MVFTIYTLHFNKHLWSCECASHERTGGGKKNEKIVCVLATRLRLWLLSHMLNGCHGHHFVFLKQLKSHEIYAN